MFQQNYLHEKRPLFSYLLALLTPSHAFSKNPSVFGIKLMTNEAKFLSKNPLCVRNTSELIHENITLDGMDIYDITMNTDDGRLATLNCCFHKNRLAVIIVNYNDPGDETLHALKYKYGPYSSTSSGANATQQAQDTISGKPHDGHPTTVYSSSHVYSKRIHAGWHWPIPTYRTS